MRSQPDDALERIRALEGQTPQARRLQLEADLAAADLAESGYDRRGRDCRCPFCYYDPEEDETERTPDALITQAEIAADDAVRRIVAEPGQPTHDLSGEPEHGPGAMRRFMRKHPLSRGDYVQRSAGCAETSNGAHVGDWYDGGRCGACGLPGPQPDDEPEPEEYDPGPQIDDEGGMSEYRYVLPEDYERGQS
jgi:hypothetical protein